MVVWRGKVVSALVVDWFDVRPGGVDRGVAGGTAYHCPSVLPVESKCQVLEEVGHGLCFGLAGR